MGKKRKLYELRSGIMIESKCAITVLEQIAETDRFESKACILSSIALEHVKRISKMNERIGVILEH